MRFGDKCPKCGYIEEKNWRGSFLDTATDIINADDVPELVARHRKGETWDDGYYAYRWTKTGRHVMRLLLAEYRARGSFRHPTGIGKKSGYRKLAQIVNTKVSQTTQTHL